MKNADLLEWWKNRAKRYPVVTELANKFLSIPATSAAAERVFSTAGSIITSKRNALLPENVDILVFINQNKKYFE